MKPVCFITWLADGVISVIISYHAPQSVYCNALVDFHNCPATIDTTNIRANTIGFLYAKDCDSNKDCDDDLTAWRRIPNLGYGIGAVHYRSSTLKPDTEHRVCLRSPIGLGPPDGCKLVRVTPTAITDKQIQKDAFLDWLPGFIANFGAIANFNTIDTAGAFDLDKDFQLTETGAFFISQALPEFASEYPQLQPSELTQLRTDSGEFDNNSSPAPFVEFQLQENAEIREAAAGVAGQLGFTGANGLIVISATIIAIVGAVVLIRKVNAWTAVLWIFLTYLVTLFVAPVIFTGFVAFVIVVAFAIGAKLQRRFST